MYLINVATFNSHILHKKKGGKLNPLEFRKRLVISLFEKYSNRSTTAAARRGQKSHENNPLWLTERQFWVYTNSIYLPLKKRKMLPEDLLYLANMRSIEKRDITKFNGLLLYVPQHVLVITTPIKISETVFVFFFRFLCLFYMLVTKYEKVFT